MQSNNNDDDNIVRKIITKDNLPEELDEINSIIVNVIKYLTSLPMSLSTYYSA